MIALDRYIALRDRPRFPVVMRQTWSNLLFLHFPIAVAEIQPLIPRSLTIDEYDGQAWVGVVLFEMVDVRFNGLPAIPGTAYFPEFNVRTYVHRDGEDPGVWFFSLDAANRLAVQVARTFFRLPYYSATMQVQPQGDEIQYASERRDASSSAAVTPGGRLEAPEPGSLDFFLVERYLFHAVSPKGDMFTGRVHHEPYRLRTANDVRITQSLTDACGIPGREFTHVRFCDGVDVTAHKLDRNRYNPRNEC